MKITILTVGKTTSSDIRNICDDYRKRISHYIKIEDVVVEITGNKVSDIKKTKENEGQLLLKKMSATDFVILLDDKGRELTSLQFASYLENLFNQSHKNICFVVGGAYGFSDAVYKRANAQLSLSKMTFSHQIIRSIFLEQLYRAFTIIHKEPYHHE